jgi:hypothetical protein
MLFILIDGVVQGEGLYGYKMHNILEEHFGISVVSVRSRGESVVNV